MIKLLHTADLHLDSPLNSLALRDDELRYQVRAASRKALENIVDLALEHQASALLVSGDLFDRAERSARTAVFLTVQFDRLKDAGIRVFYVKGNHDAVNPISGGADFPNNVHLFSGHGGVFELGEDICIHGVSFSGKSMPESLIPKFKPPVAGKVNIALMHTSVSGASGHDTYAPCSVSDMRSAGFDYWALGHIHKRQVYCEEPWIVMPGIPQGRDVGEAGSKSATLIEINGGKISTKELKTSVIEFNQICIDISVCEDWDDLRHTLVQEISSHGEQLESPLGIVRVSLSGQSDLSWQILRDRKTLEGLIDKFARDTGKLWIDKVKFDVEAKTEASAPDATSELVTIMTELQAEDQYTRQFQKDANRVFDQLPQAIRAQLMQDQETTERLLRQLSKDGVLRVVAMMRGTDLS